MDQPTTRQTVAEAFRIAKMPAREGWDGVFQASIGPDCYLSAYCTSRGPVLLALHVPGRAPAILTLSGRSVLGSPAAVAAIMRALADPVLTKN